MSVFQASRKAVFPVAGLGTRFLPGEIFTLLESVRAGVRGEIQLTDAIAAQLAFFDESRGSKNS